MNRIIILRASLKIQKLLSLRAVLWRSNLVSLFLIERLLRSLRSLAMTAMFLEIPLTLFLFCSSTAQYSKVLPLDTLAKVGSHIITAEEFLERFELMPWQNKDKGGFLETAKLECLQSLIAEKLLALEASEKYLGNDGDSKDFQYGLQRMFVRDEYYKREVLSHIDVVPSEIREGLRKFAQTLQIEVLGLISKKDGEFLFKKIASSKNKNATYLRYRDSLYTSLDTIQINFGIEDIDVENIAYSLEINGVSKPIVVGKYGLLMIRLLHKKTNNQYIQLSTSDQISKVRNIIRNRKEDEAAKKVFADVTHQKKAEAKADYFYMIADTVFKFMLADSEGHKVNNKLTLKWSDVEALQKTFHRILDSSFITMDSGSMTIKEVLLGLKNNSIVFPSLEKNIVFAILNNNIKTIIQNEMFAREGLKQNLQYSEKVQHDVKVWIDNHKSHLLAKEILDTLTITNDEIRVEYLKNPILYGATILVNIKEILIDSSSFAKEIRHRIDKGEDFSTLAKKYSKRKLWNGNGGESGLIDITTLDELGIFTMNVKIDSVAGPSKTSNGYTIFKVAERKIIDDTNKIRVEDNQKKIFDSIRFRKMKTTLDAYIGNLAKTYAVKIYNEKIKSIQTTSISMVTWRNIGFGGRIVAVPMVSPQTGWINEWKKQSQLNQ